MASTVMPGGMDRPLGTVPLHLGCIRIYHSKGPPPDNLRMHTSQHHRSFQRPHASPGHLAQQSTRHTSNSADIGRSNGRSITRSGSEWRTKLLSASKVLKRAFKARLVADFHAHFSRQAFPRRIPAAPGKRFGSHAQANNKLCVVWAATNASLGSMTLT